MKPIPNYGCVMTISEFVESVRNGSFTNDDGSGNYSNGMEMSDEHVDCKAIYKGRPIPGWAYVVWFNK